MHGDVKSIIIHVRRMSVLIIRNNLNAVVKPDLHCNMLGSLMRPYSSVGNNTSDEIIDAEDDNEDTVHDITSCDPVSWNVQLTDSLTRRFTPFPRLLSHTQILQVDSYLPSVRLTALAPPLSCPCQDCTAQLTWRMFVELAHTG